MDVIYIIDFKCIQINDSLCTLHNAKQVSLISLSLLRFQQSRAVNRLNFQISEVKANTQVIMSGHASGKLYECDHCNYASIYKHILKRHMLKHTGERPFICNYKYTQNHRLQAHMTKHTGEISFSCDHCNYTSNRSGHFKRHMLGHAKEKYLTCTECSQTFVQQTHLKRHMRTHGSSECEFICTSRDVLKRHMLELAGEMKPYSCLNVGTYHFGPLIWKITCSNILEGRSLLALLNVAPYHFGPLI